MSLKILIVDDSVTMRRIFVNSLRNIGHDNFAGANANYSKSDGRQNIVDSIVSNHKTPQDEINKLFS